MKQLLGVLALVVATAGCQAAPGQTLTAPSASGALSADANAVKPEIDPTWANGVEVNMIGVHVIEGARESQPELYAHAEELYLVAFPQPTLPGPNAGPITLPSGYRPQCNPCFHPGLPPMFVYHDHVISGAPGFGNDGTAGAMKGPWKIIIVQYDSLYAASQGFRPLTSQNAVDAAEHAGLGILQPFNVGATNPFERETGNVLICPIVSPHG